MKKIYSICILLILALALTACGGPELLHDEPMSTTTTSNTTAVLRFHSLNQMKEHLKQSGVVWDREEDIELDAILINGKSGVRLFNGENYIDIYLFDVENPDAKQTLEHIREDREIETEDKVFYVEWKEPFAVIIEDASQRDKIVEAVHSYQ